MLNLFKSMKPVKSIKDVRLCSDRKFRNTTWTSELSTPCELSSELKLSAARKQCLGKKWERLVSVFDFDQNLMRIVNDLGYRNDGKTITFTKEELEEFVIDVTAYNLADYNPDEDL